MRYWMIAVNSTLADRIFAIDPTRRYHIGRKGGCDIQLLSVVVARHQGEIWQEDGELFIRDTHSPNGTQRGHAYLQPDDAVPLSPWDELRLAGLPFLIIPSTALDPSWLRWRDGTLLRLATQLQAERTFAALPILGDALEEAGCVEPHFLDHCRDPNADCLRSSWILDLLCAAL